jgi:transcription initiation factor TFIID subunit 2
MDIIEKDPQPRLRHELCQLIVKSLTEKQGERRKNKSPFHHHETARRLWEKFNYDCSIDARLRCSLVDLYYTLFGTRKPICLLDEDQQILADMAVSEPSSRRKSPLTTREGIEEFKREMVDMGEVEPPKMISAKVLSSKRESMASDNSGELPESLDTSLPTSFEPGMFKKDKDRDRDREGKDREVADGDKEKERVREREKDEDDTAEQPPHKKHHHHHHSKVKKKKEKKKKHKHKHKHRHSHEHKKPKVPKEETLSSASSASNSPTHM